MQTTDKIKRCLIGLQCTTVVGGMTSVSYRRAAPILSGLLLPSLGKFVDYGGNGHMKTVTDSPKRHIDRFFCLCFLCLMPILLNGCGGSAPAPSESPSIGIGDVYEAYTGWSNKLSDAEQENDFEDRVRHWLNKEGEGIGQAYISTLSDTRREEISSDDPAVILADELVRYHGIMLHIKSAMTFDDVLRGTSLFGFSAKTVEFCDFSLFRDIQYVILKEYGEKYEEDRKHANKKNDNGQTMLHRVAMVDVEKMEENLIKTAAYLVVSGADVNVSDKDGFTPLHAAAQHGFLKIAKFLVSAGANVNAKDNNGMTPFDLAKSREHEEIIEYLSGIVDTIPTELLTTLTEGD